MLRVVRNILEFLAAFLGLILIVMALVVWRLNDSPIRSTFLTPYIENGIERYVPGANVQITRTLTKWDNVDHSLGFFADGVTIKNAKQKVIAEIPNIRIKLSILGLVIGQFWPVEMNIIHPQIKLDRHRDGKLYFGDLSTVSESTENETDTREVLKQTFHNLTHAYALRQMKISDVDMEVRDIATNKSWAIVVPEVWLKSGLSQLTGKAEIEINQVGMPSTYELTYNYDRLKSLHHFSSHFSGITPSQLVGGHPETLGLNEARLISLPLSGDTDIAFDPDLQIAAASINLHGGAGELRMPDLWDHPRKVKSLELVGDYDKRGKKLDIKNIELNFDGPTLTVTGKGTSPVKFKNDDFDFTLTTRLENWPMNSLKELSPKSVIPNVQEWMAKNLLNGMYNKADMTVTGSFAWNDIANMHVESGQGSMTASRGTVRYMEGMPPVENVDADGTFDLNKATINIKSGNIGLIRAEPFAITISGLSDKDQYIDIPMKTTGPITDIIKLIDNPPLRYAQAVGLKPDDLSGQAEGIVTLHFPLVKELLTKDIDVTGIAELTNVASSTLVKGFSLTDGKLAFKLEKDGIAAEGPLTINKLPLNINLTQAFHATKEKPLRQIAITGALNDSAWKVLGDEFEGTRGNATISFNLTQPTSDKSLMTGTVDLTPTELKDRSLNWQKAANVPARLNFKADMGRGSDLNVRSVSLKGTNFRADGNLTLNGDGVLQSAHFSPLVAGRTSATISFSRTIGAENEDMRVDVTGEALDVSGLMGGREESKIGEYTRSYHVKVDKLYTSEKGLIAGAEANLKRDKEGWSEIDFKGQADGDQPFTMTLTPQEDGTRLFSLSCTNFGKLLKGFGFTETVRDGEVKIWGQSKPATPRMIEGEVNIGSFSVGKLPVLALLLNATSPFGFSGLVTDSASFEKMKGGFQWQRDEVELKHMNAAGNSVGMNINGKIDMNSGRANLNGTLVPFSMVNRVLGSIPLIGDIITGGDGGGVLAVAYNISGSLADPKISVNPVSLLTPGFLRNLFFRGDGDVEIPPEPEASNTEK